jgi:hypothetical protein
MSNQNYRHIVKVVLGMNLVIRKSNILIIGLYRMLLLAPNLSDQMFIELILEEARK